MGRTDFLPGCWLCNATIVKHLYGAKVECENQNYIPRTFLYKTLSREYCDCVFAQGTIDFVYEWKILTLEKFSILLLIYIQDRSVNT